MSQLSTTFTAREALVRDAGAALAVFLVAVPLCLGIAHASGAPPVAGLLSGIVGGVVVGFFSQSRLAVSGPAAGLTTMVLAGITNLKSYEAFLCALALAGLFQLLMGWGKVGSLAKRFPHVVIQGMLTSIGLLLILKQAPHLIGYDVEAFGVTQFAEDSHTLSAGAQESNTFTLVYHAFRCIHPGAALIGLTSLAVLLGWEKYGKRRFPLVPGSLLAVAWGTALGLGLDRLARFTLEADHRIAVPPVNSNLLQLPDFGALMHPQTWWVGLTIALVASIETLLCIEALDRLDPMESVTDPNHELKAQGIGNFLCGIIGAIPITAVIVRGTVNLSAGATSKRSTITHGCLLLLALTACGPLLNLIPLAALAAVLLHVGGKLAAPSQLITLWRTHREEIAPYLATVAGVLLTDLLTGIGIGVVTYVVLRRFKRASSQR